MSAFARLFFVLVASSIFVLCSHADAETVRFRLDTTNLAGDVVDTVSVGDRFLLNTYAEDVGDEPVEGVFAAYVDIEYDAGLASVLGPIEHGPLFSNGKHGDLSAQ